jgi:cytochrome P450
MAKITSYRECLEILQSRDFGATGQERAPFLGDTLLDMNGEAHLERRRIESHLFSKSSLRHYEEHHLGPMVEQTLEGLATSSRGADGVVRADLEVLIRTILHRISALISGIDGVETPEQIDRFRDYVTGIGRGAAVDFSSEDHAAVIEQALEVRRVFVEDFYLASLERRSRLVADYRAGAIGQDDLPHDLLTILLLNEDPDWPDGAILREVSGLYMNASTSTTMMEISHAVVHLTEWLEAHPEDRTKLADMGFLRRVAHHSLRLHTTAPALLREAMRDVQLETSGRSFKAGEKLALIARLANRDPEVFGPDADVFDPYRTTPPGVSPWGLTFGGGEHQCIGRTVVTGLMRGDGDPTAGSMALILSKLFAAGIELDPDDPPVYTTATHMDAFASFPVRFRHL